MSMFSKAEADRIEATIGQIEQSTAAEIVVAEVARSSGYIEVRLFVAIVFGLGVASGVHLMWPLLPVGSVLGMQLAAGIFVWVASLNEVVLRCLVPRAQSARKTARAAELAFLEHGVFRTRDRTGVLIFLSGLERRVVILGDEGIHQRVQAAGWSELVASLIRAIKQKRAGEGVCEVVTKLGETLARAAPIRDDDTNELDNRVRGPHSRG